jgi:hypothetical protein
MYYMPYYTLYIPYSTEYTPNYAHLIRIITYLFGHLIRFGTTILICLSILKYCPFGTLLSELCFPCLLPQNERGLTIQGSCMCSF